MNEPKLMRQILIEHNFNYFSDATEFQPQIDITSPPYYVKRSIAARASRFATPYSFMKLDERLFFATLSAELQDAAPEFATLHSMEGGTAPALFGETTTRGADTVNDDAATDTHTTDAATDTHESDFETGGDVVEPTRKDTTGQRKTTAQIGARKKTTTYGATTTHAETTPEYTAHKSREWVENEQFRILVRCILAALGESGVSF